jgi:hypothetical protein
MAQGIVIGEEDDDNATIGSSTKHTTVKYRKKEREQRDNKAE